MSSLIKEDAPQKGGLPRFKTSLLFYSIFCIAILLSTVAIISTFVPSGYPLTPIKTPDSYVDGIGYLKGRITIYRDGEKIIDQDNLINNYMHNFVACKMFNDSTACTQVSGAFTTGKSLTNVVTNLIQLSTSTTTPTASDTTCPGVVSGNGLDQKIATSSYTANARTLRLSASWTASGDQNGIAKACLKIDGPAVTGTYTNPVAITKFATAFNIANGQSLSLTWDLSW